MPTTFVGPQRKRYFGRASGYCLKEVQLNVALRASRRSVMSPRASAWKCFEALGRRALGLARVVADTGFGWGSLRRLSPELSSCAAHLACSGENEGGEEHGRGVPISSLRAGLLSGSIARASEALEAIREGASRAMSLSRQAKQGEWRAWVRKPGSGSWGQGCSQLQ